MREELCRCQRMRCTPVMATQMRYAPVATGTRCTTSKAGRTRCSTPTTLNWRGDDEVHATANLYTSGGDQRGGRRGRRGAPNGHAHDGVDDEVHTMADRIQPPEGQTTPNPSHWRGGGCQIWLLDGWRALVVFLVTDVRTNRVGGRKRADLVESKSTNTKPYLGHRHRHFRGHRCQSGV